MLFAFNKDKITEIEYLEIQMFIVRMYLINDFYQNINLHLN